MHTSRIINNTELVDELENIRVSGARILNCIERSFPVYERKLRASLRARIKRQLRIIRPKAPLIGALGLWTKEPKLRVSLFRRAYYRSMRENDPYQAAVMAQSIAQHYLDESRPKVLINRWIKRAKKWNALEQDTWIDGLIRITSSAMRNSQPKNGGCNRSNAISSTAN